MTLSPSLTSLQQRVQAAGLDGWLIYDFQGLNPFARQTLQLGDALLTRRWFLYLPATGAPTLIHHRIEANNWLTALPEPGLRRLSFRAHDELDATLREALFGAHRVAMEISPMGAIPYVSRVDAGTVDRVRACGVEVVSSADLLQFDQVWSAEDRRAHDGAVRGVIAAKDAAFALIDARLRANAPVRELEVQSLMLSMLDQAALKTDHAPIVAFGSHASDGHYAVDAKSDRALEMGMCVLIDLWAGIPDRPMADITWVGFAGPPTDVYLRAWEAVRDGRDLAISLLTRRAVEAGWQVDRAVRDLITARGLGEAFRHRTGHSLGRNTAHGLAFCLDDFETHDTRRLLPGLAVTIEPGVYLGHLGVRSEVNVVMTETGAEVTTPIQREPFVFGL